MAPPGLSVAFDLAHADRPRLRSSPGGRRSRQSRRRDRLHRRHAAPVRRHRTDEDFYIDDHQCDGVDPAGVVCRRRAAAGWRHSQAFGHGAERRAQGIHRARNLHLSAAAGHAHHHRHVCLGERERARLEHDFDFRLSHARGGIDRGAGSRIHAGQRHGLRGGGDQGRTRCRQVRAAAFFLLQRAQQFSGRSREVPRRAPHVGAHHARTLQGEESASRGCCASTRRPPARR